MKHLFSLNELMLPKFLLFILMGRKVYILRVAAIVPRLNNFLKHIVSIGIKGGYVQDAVDLVPELKMYRQYERRFYFKEVFKNYEPWQDHYYGFERPKILNDPIYGYGFKQMTCSYTFWKVIEIYLLDAISQKYDPENFSAHGIMEDTIAMGREHFGANFDQGLIPLSYPRAVMNFLLILFATLITLAFILVRTRLKFTPEKTDVAFDELGDNREFELLKELSPAGKVLLVRRFPKVSTVLPECLDYIVCRRMDGVFTPLNALYASIEIIGDTLSLAVLHFRAPPGLLYEVLTLPYKRLIIRGLVNRFQPGVFIGRDAYNVDHVMRTAELRRLGIKSIGISNALFSCFSFLVPNDRYVSFDTYLVYAAPLVKQYSDTWMPGMRVLSTGGYSLPREQLLSNESVEGGYILFTIRIAWDSPEMVRMVRAVAAAFPERKVLLQFKGGFVTEEDTKRLVEECGSGLRNFEYTKEDVYVLLPGARYHISDISTFVVEAIRAGATTLVADLLDQEFNCYRHLPGLTVTTAEELVDKLRALECGEAKYPRQKYFELLGYKDEEIGFDLLLKELGINSKAA